MKKSLIILLSLFILFSCGKEKSLETGNSIVESQDFVLSPVSSNTENIIDSGSGNEVEEIKETISEELNKTNTGIITDNKNINSDIKYTDIVEHIQSYKGIINEFQLGKNDIIRLSSINYNSSKDKALYVIGDRFDGEVFYNKNDFGEYTQTERRVSAIILYDKNLNTNKVIFIGEGGWNGGFHKYFYPKFSYKDGLITSNGNIYINNVSGYTGDIFNEANVMQFSFQDNIKTQGIFTYYILDNSYLSIDGGYGWSISIPKYIWFSIKNNSENKEVIFTFPYYNLKDDYHKLSKTNQFIDTAKEEPELKWSNEDYDFAEKIEKKENFELSVLYTDDIKIHQELFNNSIYEIKNEENKVILDIKDIDPKLVNFSFEKDINIGNIDFNIFKITYKNKTIYFVYDLNNQQGSIIDYKDGLSGFDKNGNIIFNDGVLDIWTLDYKEYIEINGF